jgi:glycosyltransferase involved in cell wall biosynthesis
MRILQLIQKKQLRGAEMFASQLSNELMKKGHEVRVMALHDGDADLPFEQVEILGKKRPLFFLLNKIAALNKVVKTWKPDIIQTNAGDTTRIAVLSKIIFGCDVPIVMRNASTISQYMGSGFKKKYYQFLVDKVDAVASVSQVSKDDFIMQFPNATQKVHLLPIGINPSLFEDAVSPVGLGKYILHVGGFTFEKNHTGLLNIFEKVLHQLPDAKLVCAGDGPLFTQIKDEVKKRNLEKQVLLLGKRNDVTSLLKGAKMLVLPSIIEGLPGTILEAMYAKVPVIAYNTGGIGQVVNESTGWLIEKGNDDKFANAICELWNSNTNDLQTVLENAHQLVKKEYTNKQIAEGFEKLYSQFINNS